jgi:hypothetical protein
MAKQDDPTKTRGIDVDISKLAAAKTEELFGHVTLVEGYALTSFTGCHALVALRDTPGKTVAVLTSEQRLQSLLETALEAISKIAVLNFHHGTTRRINRPAMVFDRTVI